MDDSPAPRATPERLQAYARYVALVAEQLEAHRADDAARVRRLAGERAELEEEILGASVASSADPIAGLPDLHEVLRVGLGELEELAVTQRTFAERWDLISDGALRQARYIPVPRVRTRFYPEIAAPRCRVDLRL